MRVCNTNRNNLMQYPFSEVIHTVCCEDNYLSYQSFVIKLKLLVIHDAQATQNAAPKF